MLTATATNSALLNAMSPLEEKNAVTAFIGERPNNEFPGLSLNARKVLFHSVVLLYGGPKLVTIMLAPIKCMQPIDTDTL